jgi:hypothetical protein
VDFVWRRRSGPPLGIECKWSARDFDPTNLLAFTFQYPRAECLVVTTDAKPAFSHRHGNLVVNFVDLAELIHRLGSFRA